MKKGVVVPCLPGIDTDERWGYSHTKENEFLDITYTLHLQQQEIQYYC